MPGRQLEAMRGDVREGVRSWLQGWPALWRHIFAWRHLISQYRTLGGKLELAHTDLFLHDMPHRREFFRRAFHYLSFNGIDGDYAEFGCYRRCGWVGSMGRPLLVRVRPPLG